MGPTSKSSSVLTVVAIGAEVMLGPTYELGLLGALAAVVLDDVFGVGTKDCALELALLLSTGPEPETDT